jgi:thioredoxin-like negative regulator of GroEL
MPDSGWWPRSTPKTLPDVAGRFRIQSIPTMAVFTQGKEAARTMGAPPGRDIEDFVNSVIGLASMSRVQTGSCSNGPAETAEPLTCLPRV